MDVGLTSTSQLPRGSLRNEENAPRRGGAEERFPSALGLRGLR